MQSVKALLMSAVCALVSTSASAGIVTFNFNGLATGTAGSPQTFIVGGLDGGVNFNSTLQASAPAANLTTQANGLGVDGGTDALDVGEELTFVITAIDVVTAGFGVNFNEFTEITYNSFSGAALISGVGAGSFTATSTPQTLSGFTSLTTGAELLNSYFVGSVSARFTAFSTSAAVPEPGSIGLLCAVGLALGVRHRRRRNA